MVHTFPVRPFPLLGIASISLRSLSALYVSVSAGSVRCVRRYNPELLDPWENHVAVLTRGWRDPLSPNHTYELGHSTTCVHHFGTSCVCSCCVAMVSSCAVMALKTMHSLCATVLCQTLPTASSRFESRTHPSSTWTRTAMCIIAVVVDT